MVPNIDSAKGFVRGPGSRSSAILVAVVALILACLAGKASAQSAGARAFQARCAACHAEGSTLGPDLYGLASRTQRPPWPGYSTGLRKLPVAWTRASLDAYLKAPQAVAPGTRMLVAVPDSKVRADIVVYLLEAK